MRGYQNCGISPKIRRKRFREIKDFGLGRLPTLCYYAIRVRGSSYSGFILTIWGGGGGGGGEGGGGGGGGGGTGNFGFLPNILHIGKGKFTSVKMFT